MPVVKRASLLCCALLLSLAALSGCGQKGPLYIPQQDTPTADEPAPTEQ
jgi:predicted small lipoprotein YifL